MVDRRLRLPEFWTRRSLLSLCVHGTLVIGPLGHSSSASSAAATTSTGVVVIVQTCKVFIQAQPLRIHSVTASRELYWFTQAEAGSPVSRVMALRVFLGTPRLISLFMSARLSVCGRHLCLAVWPSRNDRLGDVLHSCLSHLSDWHSSQSCRWQPTVHERHQVNLGRSCHLQVQCNSVASSPRHSVEILTLRAHTIFLMVGIVWYHMCDIDDLLCVLDL